MVGIIVKLRVIASRRESPKDRAPYLKDRRARRLRLMPAGQAVAEAVPIWRNLHAALETARSDPNHLRSELNLLSRSDSQSASPGNVRDDV
ncbi:MAG: transcriptional regulator, MarR family [Microvirga sp.]|jgi:hypothetical protein|nr:transcriptional regulator, MarR family [Microvirga sp.]